MTKELTASAPSAIKIKVVAPPDGNISNVGAKRFRCAEESFQCETHELPDGQMIIVGARTLPLCGSVIAVGRPMSSRTVTSSLLASNVPLRGSVIPAQAASSARSGSMLALNASVSAKTYESHVSSRLQFRLHFSEECLARGWTVTARTTTVSGAGEARVCVTVAMRLGCVRPSLTARLAVS